MVKNVMKPRYKQMYAEMAEILSQFSKDKRNKVGALLLKDGRIVSTGYNGKPSSLPETNMLVDGHDVGAVHAEMNVLCFAAKQGISVKDCEIFTSHFPCIQCTKHLYQAGISKIYFIHDYKNSENPYKGIITLEKVKQ